MKRPLALLALLLLGSCSTAGPALLGNAAGRAAARAGVHCTPAENPATGLYGYVNDLGIWVIRPRFDDARSFDGCGLARVRLGDRYGAIDPLGQWVVAAVFSDSFTADAAIRSIARGRLAGIELWAERDPASGLYGYLDHYGRWAVAPQFLSACAFDAHGIAVVEVQKARWGAVDRHGTIVVRPAFATSHEAEAAVRRLAR